MSSANDRSHDLSKAKKVVAKTMKLKLAKILFNQPVDPEALGIPNYLDVVKQPMDLGTIFDKLVESEQQDWQQCTYQSAEQVLRDVSLVWSNCVMFNNREVDKPTRDAALEVKDIFEAKWKEAGLAGEGAVVVSTAVSTEGLVSETAVTDAYGTAQGTDTFAPKRDVHSVASDASPAARGAEEFCGRSQSLLTGMLHLASCMTLTEQQQLIYWLMVFF